jgi:hypothetical protein
MILRYFLLLLRLNQNIFQMCELNQIKVIFVKKKELTNGWWNN